ncbi:MAG: CheR family methyltransferase [Solirubrobacteraceae bacterium]
MSGALGRLAALVHKETGIRLGEHQHVFLQSALDRVGADRDPESFLRRLTDPLRRGPLVARLIEEVTVKETSFLRDRDQLAGIDWPLLLARARARGSDRVRVWAAACATGEEAYSLALLAAQAFGPGLAPVSILATDISPLALAHARMGRYGARSVRGLDAATRAGWLYEDGDRLVVGDPLRALVTFARHNLIRDPFPPLGHASFDLILCRNVLIYFDAPTVARVMESFEQARAPTGELVLGAADVLCASASRLGAARPRPAPAAATARSLRRPLGRLAPRPSVAGAHDAAGDFQRGLEELERDEPAAAVTSLRRALYAEPGFGLAAFKLGGAHEALGDVPAAVRAYRQALRSLDPHERHEPWLEQIDLADVTTAARARLDVLAATAG